MIGLFEIWMMITNFSIATISTFNFLYSLNKKPQIPPQTNSPVSRAVLERQNGVHLDKD